MMLKLLLSVCATGVTSSREMERRCYVDVAFRWTTANVFPRSPSVIDSTFSLATDRS